MTQLKDLQVPIEKIYSLLRDEGFSQHLPSIVALLVAIHKNDQSSFKKALKSSIIWGGSGSIVDIDLRDSDKNKMLQDNLARLRKEL